MRLIDADEMLENLTEAYIKAQPRCNELTAKVNMVVHDKITQLINYTPTAYDIDKVVAELEDNIKACKEVFEEAMENSDRDMAIATRSTQRGFEGAIEIVKKGGAKWVD